MKKIKLFRRGKLVGLVNRDFHREEKEKMVWEEFKLTSLYG